MVTSIATPVAQALAAFAAAVLNAVVVLGWWNATPEQIATVNTVVLAAIALVSAFRAGAQRAGTLTPTPNGHPTDSA